MSAALPTAVLAAVLHAERLPGPTIESPEEGSPGFLGFVVTFLLAAAVIGLAVSFSRRMRRSDHRARQRAQEDEQRAAAAGPAPVTAQDAVAQAELDARTEAGRPGGTPPPDAPGTDEQPGPDDARPDRTP